MTGGPIFPCSVYFGGASGLLFPSFFQPSANTNNAGIEEGIGIAPSIGSNATAVLRFQMPPTIPSGTLKANVWARAVVSTSNTNVEFQLADAAVSSGTDPGSATLSTESSQTFNWAATANTNEYRQIKQALTTSPTSEQMVVMTLTIISAGTNTTNPAIVLISLIWE